MSLLEKWRVENVVIMSSLQSYTVVLEYLLELRKSDEVKFKEERDILICEWRADSCLSPCPLKELIRQRIEELLEL